MWMFPDIVSNFLLCPKTFPASTWCYLQPYGADDLNFLSCLWGLFSQALQGLHVNRVDVYSFVIAEETLIKEFSEHFCSTKEQNSNIAPVNKNVVAKMGTWKEMLQTFYKTF